MNFSEQGSALRVSGIPELNAANAGSLRDQARARLKPEHTSLEIDFSGTRFIDSSGLGALIALHKTLCARQGAVRVIRPTPQVQQILELTRMHRLFEIVPT